MPEAFTLGPLLLPTRAIGFVLLIILALWMIRYLAKRMEGDAERIASIAEQAIWIGLAFSRLMFAIANWSSYAAKPWTVIYFWQPGYSFSPGIIAALLYIAFRISRAPKEKRRTYINSMIGGFSLSIILFAGLLLTMNRFVAAEIFTPGDTIPNYQATALAGAPAYFSDYKGQALVINFWATWCPPCRREMPLLESSYQTYKDQNVTFIGISVDESPDRVQKYVDSAGISYPIWGNTIIHPDTGATNTAMSRLFGVVGFPTTFFVDPDGVIQSSYVGELNQAILDKRISTLIH